MVYNGGRSIHGVTDGVFLGAAENTFELYFPDAPLVQFNQRNLLNFDNQGEAGIWGEYMLLNTLWGTIIAMVRG